MIDIKLKPERENYKEPKKGTPKSACYDVFISKIEQTEDGMVICYLGFSSEIPEGYKAELYARSNITKHGWVLANGVGIIDSDFRHEWQARFRPLLFTCKDPDNDNGILLDMKPFPYELGDACAQFSIEKEIKINLQTVNQEFDKTERDGGFGHTDGK